MKSSDPSQEKPEAPEMVVTTAPATTKVRDTPLPMKQVTALSVVLLNESMSSNMLIPFLAKLVAHLRKTTEEEAGYASGFLISAFMAGQFLTCKWWGAFSDKYGRKKPLVIGVGASSIIIFLFGLSGNIFLSVILRFMHGFFNANVLIAKTVIADITDKTNEAKGFILISLTGGVGTLIGPSIGGYLYVPAGATSIVGIPIDPNGFLSHYPAFLPCLFICAYSLVATILCLIFVDESKKDAISLFYAVPRPLRKYLIPYLPASVTGVEATDVIVATSDGSLPVTPVTKMAPQYHRPSFGYRQAFAARLTRYALVLYMLLAGSDSAYYAVFSLYTSVPRKVGGLGMSEKTIGTVLLLNSIPSVTANLVFPKLCKVIKKKMAFWRLSNAILLVMTLLLPTCSLVTSDAGSIVLLILFSVIRQVGSSWSYSMIIMLTARSTTREYVGAMNGISQAAAAVVRCVVPLIASPMFSWSVSGSKVFPFNHFLVYLVFSIPLIVSILMSRNINFDDGAVHDPAARAEQGKALNATQQTTDSNDEDDMANEMKELLTANNSFVGNGEQIAAIFGIESCSANVSFASRDDRSFTRQPSTTFRPPPPPQPQRTALRPAPTSVEDLRMLSDTDEELLVEESEDVPNNKQ